MSRFKPAWGECERDGVNWDATLILDDNPSQNVKIEPKCQNVMSTRLPLMTMGFDLMTPSLLRPFDTRFAFFDFEHQSASQTMKARVGASKRQSKLKT
jgi:hypothetical protein